MKKNYKNLISHPSWVIEWDESMVYFSLLLTPSSSCSFYKVESVSQSQSESARVNHSQSESARVNHSQSESESARVSQSRPKPAKASQSQAGCACVCLIVCFLSVCLSVCLSVYHWPQPLWEGIARLLGLK